MLETGNFVMMEQYHLDWANRRPLSRLREAMHVMRTFLDDGKIDFEGDFFKYTGPCHGCAPGAGADPAEDGRNEGPPVV